MKICKICGKPILNKKRWSYCSDECYEIRRSREYNKTNAFNYYLELLEKRRQSYNNRIQNHLKEHPNANIDEVKKAFANENLLYFERQVECYLTREEDYLGAIISKLKDSKGICQVTGLDSYNNLHVHHLNSYDWFTNGRCNPKNMIVIDRGIHRLFHSKYGRGDNTSEEFEEFTQKYAKLINNYKEKQLNMRGKMK